MAILDDHKKRALSPFRRPSSLQLDAYLSQQAYDIDPDSPSASLLRTRHWLETACIQILGCCNARDYDNEIIKKYVSPEMVDAYLEGPTLNSLDEHVELMNSGPMAKFRMEVINCVADVNEKFGLAKVWCTVRTTGTPVGLFKETVSVVHWKRKENGWICVKHQGLCQVSPFPL